MPWGRHLSRGEIRDAAVDCGILAAACLIAYWLATRILAHAYLLACAPTAAITTAVILGVAALSPHDAWRQPILRKPVTRKH
jgi:hypothetical protein